MDNYEFPVSWMVDFMKGAPLLTALAEWTGLHKGYSYATERVGLTMCDDTFYWAAMDMIPITPPIRRVLDQILRKLERPDDSCECESSYAYEQWSDDVKLLVKQVIDLAELDLESKNPSKRAKTQE